MAKKITVKSPARTRKTTPAAPTSKTTKQDTVLVMLRRANGASIKEISEATNWQPHSVRGFMSGALKKRLEIEVISEKDAQSGERRYYVAAIES